MNDNRTVDAPLAEEPYRQALSAFIDNELPLGDCAALIDHVASDPSAAERISSYRAQNAALKALFPLDAKAVLPVLVPRRPSWRGRAGAAASWLAVGLVLGLMLGWMRTESTARPAFASNADLAYTVYAPEQRHAVEVPIADEQHLLAWLSKRLDRTLNVPSLREYGYSLLGGRLLPGPTGPAAQFMYEDASGKRLTLYITAATGRPGGMHALHEANGQSTYYWVDGGMGYALSGRAARDDLRNMAVEVCGALGGKPEIWQ
jgi:anti-sigma factor RsiW